MPQQDQDFVQALSVVLKVIGAEAAKGLVYWLMSRTGDNVIVPLLAKAIQSFQQGQQLSPAEIEQLQKALQQLAQQAVQQQQLDMNLLATLVAERLRQSLPQFAPQQQYAPQQPYAPPPQYRPPYEAEYLRSAQERLRTLEETYRELERQYYLELDEARRNVIRQRLEELKREIDSLRLRIHQPYV